MKAIGRLFSFGVSKEVTRSVVPSSIDFWQPFTDFTLDEKKKFAVENQAYAVIEDQVGELQTSRTAEGSMQGFVGDQSFGLLLLAMFGTDTPALHSGETTVYDHTFTVQEGAQHQTLSYYIHDPATGQDYNYANGVVDKLEIAYELKKFVSFNATIKAKSGSTHAAYTPSTVSENHFVPQYMTFGVAPTVAGILGTLTATGTAATTIHVTGLSISTSLIQVGMAISGTNVPSGATVAAIISDTAFDLSIASSGAIGTLTFSASVIGIKSAKITFNENIEDQEVLGSLDPADFLNKQFVAEGQIEAILQNESDFKTAFMGPKYQALRLNLVNTDVTLGTSAHPALDVRFAKVTFTELGRPIKVGDLVYQSVKFMAAYSLTDTSMVKAILTNTKATY